MSLKISPVTRPFVSSPFALSLIALSFCQAAVADPDWQFSGSYRVRYENLNHAYTAGDKGSDELFTSRLLASLKVSGEAFYGQLELKDSRAWLDDEDSPLGTDDVNTLEPLQAYVGWQDKASGIDVKVGRMTLDLGTRRFVARNRFRNTLNAFTGVSYTQVKDKQQWQAFALLPVQREPSSSAALDDNSQKLDKSYADNRFWGVYYQDSLANSGTFAAYYLGLSEDDHPELTTSNRHLTTLGGHWTSAKNDSGWQYDLEGAYQFGHSRASKSASDTTDLDHKAWFLHAHASYLLSDSQWQPTLTLQWDYASGDDDANDGENNRFDTLYGARRFDFGPTGIYGAFARSNIQSPGVKLSVKKGDTDVFVGYRAIWLASDTDSLTTASLRDSTGSNGSYVGQQVEARLRHKLTPELGLDMGMAYLIKGDAFKDNSASIDNDNSTYAYTALTYSF